MNPMTDNRAQRESPSYRLPALDPDFLLDDSQRGTRLMLEYAKAELRLRQWGVRSTIVVFGSARVAGPERLALDTSVGTALRAHHTRWYGEARRFATIASRAGGAMRTAQGLLDNVIATGGGPGIMEAANRGAHDAGAPSIGLNITLPREQQPNGWSTPELTFRFHYFAMRKLHFAMRARALVVFPGGFGTLDELFEVLTLCQTRKMPPIPIVLFDRDFWSRIVDFDALTDAGMIEPRDLALFEFAEDADEIWRLLLARGLHLPQ
jgi:uncharacterized protein (TIGR00730 family)